MEAQTEVKSEVKKSNAKLTALYEIEKQIQEKWESEKIFEENPPENDEKR